MAGRRVACAAPPGPYEARRRDRAAHDLTTAIKRGGNLVSLLAALGESEARRAELRQQIAAIDAEPRLTTLDTSAVRAKLKGYVSDYRKLLRGHVPQMEQILRRLIVGKLTLGTAPGRHRRETRTQ